MRTRDLQVIIMNQALILNALSILTHRVCDDNEIAAMLHEGARTASAYADNLETSDVDTSTSPTQ